MIIEVISNENRAICICSSESQCKLSLNQSFNGKKMKTVKKLRDLMHN